MPRDFYDLLGVSGEATADELKAAYRAKAREFHPDVNADARAGAQFKTVRKAYEVLSDETERASYDRMGHERYVSRRLNGLPTADRGAERGGSRWSRGETTPDGRGGSSTGSASDASSRPSGASTSASASGSASDRAGTERTGAPGGAAGVGATGRTESRRASARVRRRPSPLATAWASVLAVGAVYLVGLVRYVGANAATASSLAAAFASDPAGAVTTAHGFGSPAAFAASAVAAGSADLLLPVGAALLVATFVVVVARFGRGASWLYVAAAAAPAVGLLAASALPRTAGVLLLVFVVLPAGATLTFALDVGRYLRAA